MLLEGKDFRQSPPNSVHSAMISFTCDAPPKGYRRILVLRNPAARLLSFYKEWVVRKQINHECMGRAESFQSLVTKLEQRRDKLHDSHLQPQGPAFPVHYAIRLGLVSQQQPKLEEELGLSPTCLNWSHPRYASPHTVTLVPGKKGEACTWTGHEIWEHQAWPSLPQVLTPEIQATIRTIFEKDYQAWSSC